jgi:hypothetical protein
MMLTKLRHQGTGSCSSVVILLLRTWIVSHAVPETLKSARHRCTRNLVFHWWKPSLQSLIGLQNPMIACVVPGAAPCAPVMLGGATQ